MEKSQNNKKSSRLKDIPSMKEITETAQNMKVLKEMMPLFGPLLKGLGADVDKMNQSLEKVDELSKATFEMTSIPDRFNDTFAEHGFILYDMMNFEIATKAVERAEAGQLKEALQDIVDYYNPETVQRLLGRMKTVKAFGPRLILAYKALNDFKEERYHACVPVVLALMDGLVNDLHEDHRGFFSESTELEAWDSIAAHSKGLGKLVQIFRKGRYKTTTESIHLPYRNGILHGIDLGYDNKTVAVKTWAALFAVREWAVKVERGELKAPETKPKETWSQMISRSVEIQNDKIEIEKWKPRKLDDLHERTFENGSPEFALNQFLSLWYKKNYGNMSKLIPIKTFSGKEKEAPARIREQFSDKILKSYEIISIIDAAAAKSDIEVKLSIEAYGRMNEKIDTFIMINEDSEGAPAVRGKPNSNWVVQTWRVY